MFGDVTTRRGDLGRIRTSSEGEVIALLTGLALRSIVFVKSSENKGSRSSTQDSSPISMVLDYDVEVRNVYG